MKTIIAGSRKYILGKEDIEFLDSVNISEVVSGKAPGVDTCGELWAKSRAIPIKEFPANWKKYRNAAGPIRNQQMADYAEQLIAFWDGKSTGTKDMIKRGKTCKLNVIVRLVNCPNSLV